MLAPRIARGPGRRAGCGGSEPHWESDTHLVVKPRLSDEVEAQI